MTSWSDVFNLGTPHQDQSWFSMLTYDEAAYCGVDVALDKSLMLTCFDKKVKDYQIYPVRRLAIHIHFHEGKLVNGI